MSDQSVSAINRRNPLVANLADTLYIPRRHPPRKIIRQNKKAAEILQNAYPGILQAGLAQPQTGRPPSRSGSPLRKPASAANT